VLPAPQCAEDETSDEIGASLDVAASLDATGSLDAAGSLDATGSLDASTGTSDDVTTGAAPSASSCWM
jgi:hypothetical protein